MFFPIIVDNKQSEEDDGDNLQSQGHNGELEPHVGGVGRHPETSGAYLSLSDTHSLPVDPLCTSWFFFFFYQELHRFKGGKKVMSGFKVMPAGR